MTLLLAEIVSTWRRWPELITDYGRELYLAWRICEGGSLYRDNLYYYGPFGAHLNGFVFALFGPGCSTLCMWMLALLCAFTGMLYAFLTATTSRLTACMATVLFLTGFAFGNFVPVSTYNFISPYSHDAVYGFYACSLMVGCFWLHISGGGWRWLLLAGVAAGIAYMTKPETLLNAVCVGGLGTILAAKREPSFAAVGRPFGAGMALPFCAMSAFLCVTNRSVAALTYTHASWLATLQVGGVVGSTANLIYLGLDAPLTNLASQAVAATALVAVVLGLASPGLIPGQSPGSTLARFMIPPMTAVVAIWLLSANWPACGLASWLSAGKAFVASAATLSAYRIWLVLRTPRFDPLFPARAGLAMVSLFSLVSLFRMAFNPTIEHYGFVQACPAAIDLVILLTNDIPALRIRLPNQRRLVQACGVAICVAMACGFAMRSQALWMRKNYPFADGRDFFYTWDPRVKPFGPLMQPLLRHLQTVHPRPRSLMVCPEGVMMNYVLRVPTPIQLYDYLPHHLAMLGEDSIIRQLSAEPPEWIVVVGTNLSDYGATFFGVEKQAGRMLARWIKQNYEAVQQVGGDPLNPSDPMVGVALLRCASGTNSNATPEATGREPGN
jgi:hypothetical protein